MYSHRQYYFSRFAKSHPILKFVNIYDRQSFIREWIFDNIYVCILTYIVFFGALWYASKVIKRIEESNERMLEVVAENREKLDDVMALRNKRQEYEEVVMKVKGAQRVTSKHLETEIEKLQSECSETTERLTELEKLLDKINFSRNGAVERLEYPEDSERINASRKTSKRNRLRVQRCSSHRSRLGRPLKKNMGCLSLDRRRDDSTNASDENSSCSSMPLSKYL
ncbi:uncharacterized protein [Fopius arisanus]|uniref:Uncharacterized protein n=1 Tax=Fopius arisanus TaxID=64838 RepID=A0A9R1TZX7_9HYME|nr:PREDICTED: uncharacterized protein LOC105266028 [Fopius arisanus]